jgi:hypothetical protein
MIPKPVDQVTEDDLRRLIGSSESRELEFKQSIGRSDEDVKEFLKDVSAMANATGGDVIYGVVEDIDENGNTVATEIQGIAGENSDDVVLRFDSLIRDCIKPRLLGIRIQPVLLNNTHSVFIVRVPRSWNAPHVVDRKGHWRFYYRDSAGTHPMDVTELRNAVTFADTLTKRLEEFRLQRLATIAADPLLESSAKIVLHFQPLSSIQPEAPLEMSRLKIDARKLVLIPSDTTLSETRLNFEGILAYNPHNPDGGYIQLFRNGSIEAVDAHQLKGNRIPIRDVERTIINATVRLLGLINDLGLSSSVQFHISLLGVKGYKLKIDTGNQIFATSFIEEAAERHEIDRSDLLLPGLLLTEETVSKFADLAIPDRLNEPRYLDLGNHVTAGLLHPLFSIIWNAAGFRESLYFDSEEAWTGQLRWDL